jgi:glucose/arabinose dehydrogenase
VRARIAAALLGAGLSLGGCGGGDEEETTTASPPSAGKEERQGQRPPPTGEGEGGVELTEIGSFDQPVHVTQAPAGGDLYVTEQTGRVKRLPEKGGEPEVFLDLSGEVSCCGEQGLLSIAFAPDFAKSGLVYASYTNTDGDSRVIEYRSEAGAPPDPESARELLAQDQPYSNHNGGLLLFDPEGRLLLGLGDGGSAGDSERNAQDPSSLLGKLVSVDTSGNGEHEIVALGLRNPWRFSFDRETGDLWIGDVGQDGFEEVNGVTLEDVDGANFGWSAFEGDARFNEDEEAPGHLPPVLTYPTAQGCAVTGGYVVRDPELRSLYGRYLYGDYCNGQLRSFTAEPGRDATDDVELGVEVPGLSSFGEDVEGNVYAVSIEGPVYRLDPTG